MTSPGARRPGRGWETLIAVLAALAAGGAGGYLLSNRPATSGPTTEHAAARGDRVTALGRLQPAGGVIPVVGPPGDRIAKLYPVAPGNELAAGTPVAELAGRKERLQELLIAESQQAEAEKTLKFARVAGERKVEAATAELRQAQANEASDLAALDARLTFVELSATAAGKQVERLKTVKVSAEEADKAGLAKAQADAEVATTRATIEKTRTTYKESQKAAEARIAAARAELDEAVAKVPTDSARQRLALARQFAEQAVLKAPVRGTVLRVTGREGQPTGVEPVIQMADLSAMTAVAEVYESDVGRVFGWVKTGPVRAEVKNPALPRPLTGVVRSEQDIAMMIARNQVFAVGPREDADRRVVDVVVHLDPASAAEARRLVGLQVTVTLEPAK